MVGRGTAESYHTTGVGCAEEEFWELLYVTLVSFWVQTLEWRFC